VDTAVLGWVPRHEEPGVTRRHVESEGRVKVAFLLESVARYLSAFPRLTWSCLHRWWKTRSGATWVSNKPIASNPARPMNLQDL